MSLAVNRDGVLHDGLTALAAAQGVSGAVVRCGQTVRRQAHAGSRAIHELLRHLDRSGFGAAPRPLGFDDSGREVLTFLEGDPGAFGWYSEAALLEVGQLVRRLHDATTGWRPPVGAVWSRPYGAFPGERFVVCHNDINPTNVLFRDGHPVALVDWECTAPNPVLAELAQLAWAWTPLFHPELLRAFVDPVPGVEALAHRMGVLCDGYGLDDRTGLVSAVRLWLGLRRDAMRAGRDPRLAAMWNSEQRTYTESTISWLDRVGDDLDRALTTAE